MGSPDAAFSGSAWEKIALRAHARRAHRFIERGEWDQAIAVYREILKLDPRCARAYYDMGLCYQQTQRLSEAVAAFRQAQALGEREATARLKEVRQAMRHDVADLLYPGAVSSSAADTPETPAVVVGGRVITTSNEDTAPQDEANISGQTRIEASQDAAVKRVEELGAKLAAPAAIYGFSDEAAEVSDPQYETVRRPITCPPVDDVFGPRGPLAEILGSQYRARSGQIQMANLVRDALQEQRHALIEAGTGIGKSFAYLIPVLWSGTSAIVSTSNKGLMNQLWEQDIPRLQQIAPQPFQAALLKGRRNYICAMRLEQLRHQPRLRNWKATLNLIRERLDAVPSGDVEVMRLPPELSARLTVGSRECRGRLCPQFKDCYYEEAKQKALQAELVVTNHALLCHNILLADNYVLPLRPVLIIDEAHQLARYAIDTLTWAFEHDQFWGLMNSTPVRQSAEQELLSEVSAGYEGFLRAIEQQRPGSGHTRWRPSRWALEGELQAGLALWDALQQVQRTLSHASGLEEGEQEAALRQSEEMATTVHALAIPEPETHIRLCELDETMAPGSAGAYHAAFTPLDVATPLRRLLFDVWPRVICTSATLSVNNDLGWFQRQMGLSNVGGTSREAPRMISRTLPGPFDYARQMLIYTPHELNPVYDEQRQAFTHDYVRQLTAEVARLLEASRGRALVLCTSRARMAQLYESLAPVFADRYPCYLQGDLAQPELVARFKEDGNAILFATRGFWEGLDIPGDALALVILDKVPFVPYDDPVIRRQEAQIKARGGNPFFELQLGSAVLNLRQGAGRLIRSETDRGVIALLDGRVLRKRYGRQILDSLPGGRRTTVFEDVASFLNETE